MGKFFKLTCVLLLVIIIGAVIVGSIKAAYELPQVVEKDGVLWAGDGWLMREEGLNIAYFTGSPEEIGLQHGVLLGDDPELRDLFESLDPASDAEGIRERVGWFFKNLYARFRFYPTFKSHTPDEYLQEMKGFIRGASGDDTDDIYDIMMGNAGQDLAVAGPSCSAFAAWGESTADEKMYVGRNLDHAEFMKLAHYQYVGIYEPEKGYKFAVHNYPSYIGTMSGMNENGIVVTSNYSIALQEEMTIDGLPFILMLRNVLQYAGNLDEALEIIKQTPRTIGLNLMLADAASEEAVVVEITANKMAVREADDYIYSSNMFQDQYMKQFQAPGWMSSALRDSRFAELGEFHRGKIDLEVSRDILRDKLSGLSREGFYAGINTEVNMASMVFVPDKGEIWVGTVEEDGLVPYAADASFVGVNAAAIWNTGEPQELIGVIPPTDREGEDKYWFKVRDASRLIALNRNEEAMTVIKEVLDKYPEAAIPQLFAGRLYNRLENYEKGLEYFNKFIAQQEHPEPYNLVQAYFWAGLASDLLDEREDAINYYSQALEVKMEDMPGGIGPLLEIARQGTENKLTVENGVVKPVEN